MFPQPTTPYSILTVMFAVKAPPLTAVSDVRHVLTKALTPANNADKPE